jgi:protein TonB
MKIAVEIGFFLAVATGVHVAVWQSADPGGTASAGSDGDSLITLQASSPSLQSLVDQWERQPAVMASLAPTMPQRPDQVPQVRQPTPDIAFPTLSGNADLPRLVESPESPVTVDRSSYEHAFASPERSVRPPQRMPEPVQTRSAPNIAGQVAAGSGQRSHAGNQGASASAAVETARTPALMATWGQVIRAEIERRKTLPKTSRAQGSVTLAISVHTDGRLSAVAVRKSSGHPDLDAAAIVAVKRARIRSAPKGLAPGVHQFVLPMSFVP